MELATFLILLGALAVGISGSVASTWGLRREVYRLKLDVVDIQNRILTENKRKAADARWQKPDKLAVEAEQLAAAAGGQQAKNPWDLF